MKDNATRAITGKILPEMEAFALAGSNPLEAARHLENCSAIKQRLGATGPLRDGHGSEQAKRAEWAEWDVDELDFVPAPDACPICMALAGTYAIADCPLPVRDTHPRCRCGTRPAESET